MNPELFKALVDLCHSKRCELIIYSESAFLKIHLTESKWDKGLVTMKFIKDGDKFVPDFASWLHES